MMTKTEKMAACGGFEEVVSMIGGKWKLWILRLLIFGGTKRFNELRRDINGITQTMLTNQLRALEADGLVARKVYAEVPPRVEYSATPKALDLEEFFTAMYDWSDRNVLTQQDGAPGRAARPAAVGGRRARRKVSVKPRRRQTQPS